MRYDYRVYNTLKSFACANRMEPGARGIRAPISGGIALLPYAADYPVWFPLPLTIDMAAATRHMTTET